MAHWQRPPHPRLARFVEGVAFSDDREAAGDRPPIRVVPDGRLDVLFSIPAGGTLGGTGDRHTPPARADVFGTKTRVLLIPDGPPVDNVSVRFRPGAAHRFLRTPADALTDAAVDLAALWGDRSRALLRRVARAREPEARARLIERELLDRLSEAEDESDLDRLCAHGVARLQRSGGQIPVRLLATELGVGERRLERAFRDRVGVSPKRLARILRFGVAFDALKRGEPQAATALRAGYSDQAHMLRDFRELAGLPPSGVFERGDRARRSENEVSESSNLRL